MSGINPGHVGPSEGRFVDCQKAFDAETVSGFRWELRPGNASECDNELTAERLCMGLSFAEPVVVDSVQFSGGSKFPADALGSAAPDDEGHAGHGNAGTAVRVFVCPGVEFRRLEPGRPNVVDDAAEHRGGAACHHGCNPLSIVMHAVGQQEYEPGERPREGGNRCAQRQYRWHPRRVPAGMCDAAERSPRSQRPTTVHEFLSGAVASASPSGAGEPAAFDVINVLPLLDLGEGVPPVIDEVPRVAAVLVGGCGQIVGYFDGVGFVHGHGDDVPMAAPNDATSIRLPGCVA